MCTAKLSSSPQIFCTYIGRAIPSESSPVRLRSTCLNVDINKCTYQNILKVLSELTPTQDSNPSVKAYETQTYQPVVRCKLRLGESLRVET